MTDAGSVSGFFSSDAWTWWQARRLRYNLTLAAAGLAAYLLNAALFFGFGHPLWRDGREALSTTLFLGVIFLVVMGAANVLYLAGPAVEVVLKPQDLGGYRKTAFGMGFWGSAALPFIFPALSLALLIGGGAA